MDELETTTDENIESTEKPFGEELREAIIFSAATTAAMMAVVIAVPIVAGAVSDQIDKFNVWRSDRKTKKLNEQTESE